MANPVAYRGIPELIRASGSALETEHHGPYGQVFTPFVSMRGDFATMSIKSDSGVSTTCARRQYGAAPCTVGVEYRYPRQRHLARRIDRRTARRSAE
jgi:hypothetical protein